MIGSSLGGLPREHAVQNAEASGERGETDERIATRVRERQWQRASAPARALATLEPRAARLWTPSVPGDPVRCVCACDAVLLTSTLGP